MIAWMLPARRRLGLSALGLLAMGLLLPGCGLVGGRQTSQAVVDAHQPKELEMVSMPPYVVEPPDELEIAVRPAIADFTLTTVSVQSDGNLDLGFAGDVYVSGLTLGQIETKLGAHLQNFAARRGEPSKTPIEVSVRLVNGSQSKYYYVLGKVSNQGKFPINGNETVLDAILAAGLRSNSLPEKAYLVRPHPSGGADQIYKIDWIGIKERGDTMTNYQLFPGDRIVVPGGKAPGLLSTLMGG